MLLSFPALWCFCHIHASIIMLDLGIKREKLKLTERVKVLFDFSLYLCA